MGSLSSESCGITPVNYKLSIFNIKCAPEWRFDGCVVIEAQIAQPVTEIILHAASLEILSVELSQGSQESTQICKSFASDGPDGITRLFPANALKPGPVSIRIEYQGSIGNSMVGFFRARYRAIGESTSFLRDGEYSFLLATHFEPCHARWAFPCFDEPHLKATFDLDIEKPEGLTALSNMPVKNTTKLTDNKAGLERVLFERTPVMSTYLLAWAVGELEYVEALTESYHGGIRIPVRVYTPLGLSKHATLALECAWKALDLFQRLFKIDYPIPKSDHLVVPEFVSGAMENWGLITYKPTKILFDPKTSNNRVMSKAVYVVAHELAHQWFGNLVTMNSWSELWLNEGFATWAGYLAVEHLFPEWNIWGQYVAEIMDEVLKLDSLPTTHAVETLVQGDNDARQMFDQISYSKASALIRMLAAHLGLDTFLKGLSSYLSKHAYQNARSQDLWNSLSEASGTNVSLLMDSWIHTRGFPVVQLLDLDGQLHIRQRSMLSLEGNNSSLWQIPMKIILAEADDSESRGKAPVKRPSGLNRGHVGYFCIDYKPGELKSIVQSLPELASVDLVGVIVDMSNLTTNTLKPTGELLDLIWSLKDSRDCFVWVAISRSLSFIRSVLSEYGSIMVGFNKFIAELISSVKSELQWTADDMTYTEAELHKAILSLAFSTGIKNSTGMIQQARQCFARWSAGDTSGLQPSMRGVILSGCVGLGSESEFKAVKGAFEHEDSLDGQEILLGAMGSISSPELAEQVLDFAFTNDKVALQHLHLLGGALGQNNDCRLTQWEYVKCNWDQVFSRLNANSICRDWWIEESLSHFADLKIEDDMACFLTQNAGPDIRKPLENVKANIRRNALYKERAREDVSQWLTSHGFI